MLDPASVTDLESFLAFLRELVVDREKAVVLEAEQPSPPFGRDAGGWENTTIETYLDACRAWAQDRPISGTPSWRLFAEVLRAGKLYE